MIETRAQEFSLNAGQILFVVSISVGVTVHLPHLNMADLRGFGVQTSEVLTRGVNNYLWEKFRQIT
ncbi:MAG: hypothetical protein U9O54_00265 [Chloroflexota bacterium]|nr:hypothetical protein [Chloroflexota bacterium]